MSTVPDSVLRLIEKFDQHRDEYLATGYIEEALRGEFIDPFFQSLGWDVANVDNKAERYKDLVREGMMKAGAPDYCFRVGGNPKFYVEAKKPSLSIANDPAPAFQLRSYAWTAKLPLGIVTDFEEFAVYDCRIPPKEKDAARTARREFFTYRDYPDRWDWIASIFSKDAIEKGLFDEYAGSQKGRGVETVDDVFLKDIEDWRDKLAHNIANRNRAITDPELNFAVQSTIDRILFLRMAEDRGTEPYGQLQALLNGTEIYDRLKSLYRNADHRYNSGLFHFDREESRATPPDKLTLALEIDDAVLKEIIKSLYFPKSQYQFSVMPPDILGSVYEQFLGKVIHITPGHQARIEEKPEVKKAGGVYYTPKYIVDYIVEQTVGRMISDVGARHASPDSTGNVARPPVGRDDRGAQVPALQSPLPPSGFIPSEAREGEGEGEGRILSGLSPKQISKLRILDPACGSGSFLVGAYRKLLDYHRDWYVADGPEKHKKELRKAPDGYLLTTAEKKRILINNIFGVDIDRQAVEVTKLNLLLSVLEYERQLDLIAHERALPDLDDNIKCGNSLIGPDYFTGQLLPDEEEMRRVNPFDWNAEFPAIMKSGGFDCVIGNPPYVRQESLSEFKEYLQKTYEAYDGGADLYAYFMERGVKLLRKEGLFSIIVSSSFLRATYGEPLRRALKKHSAVTRIVDFGGLAVFANAKDTYVCIPLLAKGAKEKKVEVSRVTSLTNLKLAEHVAASRFEIPNERLSSEAWSLKSDEEADVFAKILDRGKPLGDYVGRRLFYGIKTGFNEAFIIDGQTKKALLAKDKRNAELIHPLLGGEDIRRYIYHETGLWLIFTRRGINIDKYPAIREHLAQWKEDLTPKRDRNSRRGRKPGRYKWYEIQDDVAYYEAFDGPKLIFPDICKGPRFSVDTQGHYLANTAYCLGTDDPYLLGVLNSRLFWFAISNLSIPFGIRAGEYRYRLIYQYMEKVPIRVINDAVPADKVRHDRMVKLVDAMLELHKRLAKAKSDSDRQIIQRQIDHTDTEIDTLVYDLYGLTKDEIKIVEGS